MYRSQIINTKSNYDDTFLEKGFLALEPLRLLIENLYTDIEGLRGE